MRSVNVRNSPSFAGTSLSVFLDKTHGAVPSSIAAFTDEQTESFQLLHAKAETMWPEELEAYRLLLRRYEPVVTNTTVSKLVDMLATRFGGDLMDSLTDFERRVTSWEHDAKETLPDLIKIGVAIKGLEKGCLRGHVLINTAGTTEWTKFVKEIENVKLARRNTQPVPMDLSAMGSQDQNRKKTEYTQTTKRVDGLARTTKPKASPARAKANKTKARAKACQMRAKARARAKGKVNNTARKGRKDFTNWRSTKTNKKHEPVKNTQSGPP